MNVAFISHPSVRIKGTENNYEPVNCSDSNCTKAWPHMHCPFCVKSETFQDPVILKAHYRVKHVDKGIEFAGLKILRCCELCDIVGTIKGTKELKGAHWHCYKCKNGFTRRDEAIKHYRTHFRNPSTTFQIQVSQDINQMARISDSKDRNSTSDGSLQEMAFIETVVTTVSGDNNIAEVEPITIHEAPQEEEEPNKTSSSGDIQVSVAANETVGTCEGQTFVIVPSSASGEVVRTIESGEVVRTIENAQELEAFFKQQKAVTVESSSKNSSILSQSMGNNQWKKEKESLLSQIVQLKAQVTGLTTDKSNIEHHLNSEIESLKVQLHVANNDIASYQKREAELLNQLKIPLGDRLSSLLIEMKTQHEELLHQQLAQLRQEYLQQQLNEELEGTQSMEPEKVVHVDVASLVQDGHVPHMIVEENDQVVLTQNSYGGISASGNIVLTSQSLMSEKRNGATQLFVVPHDASTDIQHEQVKIEHQNRDSEVEEIYHEDLQPSGTQMEFTTCENEIVGGQSSEEMQEKIILLQSSVDGDTVSPVTYGDGTCTEELEISIEDSENVLTLHSSSSGNKRNLDEVDSLPNSAKRKQREEL